MPVVAAVLVKNRLLTPSGTAGNPFLGQNYLEIVLGGVFRALKGLTGIYKNPDQGCGRGVTLASFVGLCLRTSLMYDVYAFIESTEMVE